MRHIKVTLTPEAAEIREVLIAVLAQEGYDGFEEETAHLHAYIAEEQFDAATLEGVVGPFGVEYATEVIEPQNWNALWESGFEPVVVDGFCTIRADFHNPEITTPHVIVITPKMSFGTGHHATTQLMMMAMEHLAFTGKVVLDFGTGTGVLAILAGKLGAAKVIAIDNDEWAINNAAENLVRNECTNIEVLQATITDVQESEFGIILANINKNILLQYMKELHSKLMQGGVLLMSGLLADDEAAIAGAATDVGLALISVEKRSGWISITCLKH